MINFIEFFNLHLMLFRNSALRADQLKKQFHSAIDESSVGQSFGISLASNTISYCTALQQLNCSVKTKPNFKSTESQSKLQLHYNILDCLPCVAQIDELQINVGSQTVTNWPIILHRNIKFQIEIRFEQ